MTSTINQLASALSTSFYTNTRDNGTTFRALRSDSPEWMHDAIRAVHDNASMLPDDWRFAAIEDAAEAIANATTDLDDARHAFADAVDIYTHDLLTWLASNQRRVAYVDDAFDEYGYASGGITAVIARGQYAEREEIWDQLLAFLLDETERQSSTEAA